MSDDQFTKLFKYMQDEFGHINGRFDTLTGAVDAFAKQSETSMQAMLAPSHKVDRLERWIMKIAEETGVKPIV